jgi:hypothetical protein
VPVNNATFWEKQIFKLLLLTFPFGFFVVVDNSVDGLLEFGRLLFRPEKLDSDTSSQRVKIFIKKQFFHFLIDDDEFLAEDTSQDELIFLVFDIVLSLIEYLIKTALEVPIEFLSLQSEDFDCAAYDGGVGWFVVPPKEGHFLDDSK